MDPLVTEFIAERGCNAKWFALLKKRFSSSDLKQLKKQDMLDQASKTDNYKLVLFKILKDRFSAAEQELITKEEIKLGIKFHSTQPWQVREEFRKDY